jgi:hypothetical protein
MAELSNRFYQNFRSFESRLLFLKTKTGRVSPPFAGGLNKTIK